MKKITMAVVTMILVMIMALSANAEGTEFVGCAIRTTHATSATNGSNSIVLAEDNVFTIIGENNGQLAIDVNGENYWLDSSDVFINVKDYIPSIEVNLVMADKAIFQMANEEIPGLWGKKFYHYRTGSENKTEAWLTVATAKKLAKAQEIFLNDGKCIVVYDAYRPYSVTKEFQSAYRAYLDTKSSSFKKKWFGTLGESWFLAQKASAHNYGIAIDCSLRDLKTGNIMDMPTAMHNLDYRSAEYNWVNVDEPACENARYLARVMKQAGMKTLKSEWWHFQDGKTPDRNKVAPIDIQN